MLSDGNFTIKCKRGKAYKKLVDSIKQADQHEKAELIYSLLADLTDGYVSFALSLAAINCTAAISQGCAMKKNIGLVEDSFQYQKMLDDLIKKILRKHFAEMKESGEYENAVAEYYAKLELSKALNQERCNEIKIYEF